MNPTLRTTLELIRAEFRSGLTDRWRRDNLSRSGLLAGGRALWSPEPGSEA